MFPVVDISSRYPSWWKMYLLGTHVIKFVGITRAREESFFIQNKLLGKRLYAYLRNCRLSVCKDTSLLLLMWKYVPNLLRVTYKIIFFQGLRNHIMVYILKLVQAIFFTSNMRADLDNNTIIIICCKNVGVEEWERSCRIQVDQY